MLNQTRLSALRQSLRKVAMSLSVLMLVFGLSATVSIALAERPAVNHRFFLELPNGAKMPLPGAKIHSALTSEIDGQSQSFISNQCRYNVPEEDTGGLEPGGRLETTCEYGDKTCHMCQTGNSCLSDDYGAPYLPKSFNSADKIYDKASHDASYSFFKNQTFTSALNTNYSAIAGLYTSNNIRGFANARWRGEIDRNNPETINGQDYFSLSMVDTDESYARFRQFLSERQDKNTGQNLSDAWRDLVGQPNQITDPSRWEKGEIFRKALGGNILHGEITWILSVTPPVSTPPQCAGFNVYDADAPTVPLAAVSSMDKTKRVLVAHANTTAEGRPDKQSLCWTANGQDQSFYASYYNGGASVFTCATTCVVTNGTVGIGSDAPAGILMTCAANGDKGTRGTAEGTVQQFIDALPAGAKEKAATSGLLFVQNVTNNNGSSLPICSTNPAGATTGGESGSLFSRVDGVNKWENGNNCGRRSDGANDAEKNCTRRITFAAAPTAPVCTNLVTYGTPAPSLTSLQVGSSVSFLCSTAPGSTKYEYRVTKPDSTVVNLASVGTGATDAQRASVPFTVAQNGQHSVQCRGCDASNTCTNWETPACTKPFTVSTTPAPLACLSTTVAPTTAVVASTQNLTVTCGRVTGAVKYKVTLKTNVAAPVVTTVGVNQPATGNPTHSFAISAQPAGTYEVSCVPCTDTAMTTCAPVAPAVCKANYTLTAAPPSGSASCLEKVAYTLTGTTRTVLPSGTAQTGAGYIDPSDEFYYDIVLTAPRLTSSSVAVTDTLPPQLEFINARLGTGAVATQPAANSFFTAKTTTAQGTTLRFAVPAFGSASTPTVLERRTITIKVKVASTATPGIVTNNATVSTNSVAGTACSNTLRVPNAGTATCVAKEAYRMNGTTVGERIAEGATIPAGTTIRYKVLLNAAAQTAGQVVVTDQLPAGLAHVDAGDFTFNSATGTYSKTIESFTGAQALSFTAKVKNDVAAGSVRNSATVVTKDRAGQPLDSGDSCSVGVVVPAFTCNANCATSSQCQSANADFICSADNNNRCRLKDNESSENCQPKTFACNSSCGTDADCRTVNAGYSCVNTSEGNRCRLSTNQSATNCQAATPTPTPASGCNQKCVNNADCSNPSHVCHSTGSSSVCRLAEDVNSTTCSVSTSVAVTPSQPVPPAELPQTGPENWSNWLKSGLVVIGVGAMLLLLI